MSVLAPALTWLVAGVLGAVALPRLRRRRMAALVPMAAAIAGIVALGGSGADVAVITSPGGLVLGRPGGGLVVVSALAVTVTLLLAPPADSGDLLVLAICGALSAVVLGSGSPLVWASCLLAGSALVGIHWVTVLPSRSTLAAARVGPLAAALLVAVTPFLPLDATATRPRAHLVAALLAGGAAGGLALVPLGGWVMGVGRLLRGPALAPWLLLLMPATLLSTQPLELEMPLLARPTFGGIVLAAGAATALWAALTGTLAAPQERYLRVLVADLGLVGIGLASVDNMARLGSLLLLLTHLCVAPLLLQEPAATMVRPRRLAWLALSGIPPSAAFWGRFALLIGVVNGLGAAPMLVVVPVMAMLLVVSVRAIARPNQAREGAAPTPAALAAAWLPPLAALTVGIFPQAAVHALFGVS